jgi:hypothetical protein
MFTPNFASGRILAVAGPNANAKAQWGSNNARPVRLYYNSPKTPVSFIRIRIRPLGHFTQTIPTALLYSYYNHHTRCPSCLGLSGVLAGI